MSAEQPATKTSRGPAEEVVAKRLKALGKKLQRFRGYASQKPETLNTDQKAGLASLPALEGTVKELEELSKQIEYVELEQFGKARELKDQAKKDAEAYGLAQVEQFQSTLSTPLSLFLRLYNLLHPARASDHDNLTFGHLELPRNMQEEVQATDVLRVGRWYEDLLAGGERGKAIVKCLATGPSGADEEDDRVHHLLKLLVESDSLPAEEEAPASEEPEQPVEEAPAADEVVEELPQEAAPEETTAVEAEPELQSQSQVKQQKPKDMVFNFLQEDELAASQPQTATPAETILSENPIRASAPDAESQPTVQSAIPSFDWAAEDDEQPSDSPAPVRNSSDAQPSQATQAEAKTSIDETSDQIIEENALANAHAAQPLSQKADVLAPPAVDSTAPAPPAAKNVSDGRGRGKGGRGGRSGRGGGQKKGQQKGQQNQQLQQQQAGQGGQRMDDDGFQVVGKSPAAQHGPVPARGRGRGKSYSRGRGARGGPRPSGDAPTPPQDGQSSPAQGQQRQQSQQSPRPSRLSSQQAKPTPV
ncbi:hypothetical protein I307_04879 [Cryptococcus deuterogattii 99/473]|uniref:Uncharacterized protein n=1 Tax=Cryptococcus deuterogattii Ram5 TaxID=1296110 RepID=A0A0D0UXJ0_9TREE|nr:hypothetical protein I309_03992 [Cryptococcus deuterogattii LA55]KIR40021.1 hypothetical protein I313_03942 [Cryptococcus deuterogattii Ram5]KIR90994.1 hypothetical protein I304_05090 [Cryptococcus deuterogattii CBS 10090]KIY55694.1 hypothetical protein I307_04879 [Cryptococcus deuterogattii 99/473]